MKFHKQLFLHRPSEGVVGDCHRTASASLLDLEPHEVPHFAEEHFQDGEAFDRAVKTWLRTKGYALAGVGYVYETFDQFMKVMEVSAPGVYYLLCGTSRNGTNHTVIGCGGAIAHDPAQDNSGIVGPCSDGCYIVQYLVPLRFCERAAA